MIYFIFFFITCYLSINYEKFKNFKNLEKFIFFSLFILIGFRGRTGGDYRPYIDTFDRVSQAELIPNPFIDYYQYLNYVSGILNLDFFGINLISSFIFTFLLYYFLKNFKNIYLSLVISFPVIVMIYGIGSIRQGIALMFFLSIFNFKSEFKKIILLIISVLFHFTGIVNLFIYFASYCLKHKKYFIPSILLIIFLIIASNNGVYKNYFNYYIFQGVYFSSGFLLRNSITFVCAIIYLIVFFYRKIDIDNKFEYPFLLISILTVLIYPLGIFFSTPADRIMAYFLPLQIVLINMIYEQVGEKLKQKVNVLLCAVYATILGVWYYLGNHSGPWEYELFFLPIKFF